MRTKYSDKSFNFCLVFLVLTSLLVAACGGKVVQENPLNLPEWFQNPPEDPSAIFSTATATSKDMQMSIKKAKQEVRVDLAQQMETKIKSMTKQFSEEVDLGEDADFLSQTSVVSKSVTSKVLTGSRAKEVKTIKESGVISNLQVGLIIISQAGLVSLNSECQAPIIAQCSTSNKRSQSKPMIAKSQPPQQ